MKSNHLSGRERRSAQRHPLRAPIAHESGNNGIFHAAEMLNYSSHGCCFETRLRHKPGEDVFIDFHQSKGQNGPSGLEGLRARVIWCKPLNAGGENKRFGVGVRYYEALN